jgi:hypothetical protein
MDQRIGECCANLMPRSAVKARFLEADFGKIIDIANCQRALTNYKIIFIRIAA